jgi:alcohol dehydrogenase class IV
MALAASYAGMAFTRANVGYVHAIAHQLGGRYHVPHGLANAMLLPSVMRFSAPEIVPRLARLAVAAGLGEAHERDEQLAERFLDALEQLNRDLNIPTVCEALQAKDIPLLAKAACLEAETGYPVPRYMSQKQCEGLLRALLPPLALAAPPAKKAAAKKAPAKKSPAKKKSA